MLFQLAANTPRFRIFELLNAELLYFIEQSVAPGEFRRELFSDGAVGQACWNNTKHNSGRAQNDLTRDKFEKLFNALRSTDEDYPLQLFQAVQDNQNLQDFFRSPNCNILDSLPAPCQASLKDVATHLYCATKDLGPIITAAGGIDITAHFKLFREDVVNGNICKACGMNELAAFRAAVEDGDQWRADYDHQLCKSKYPIFAVHPDNLIPLCDVCNQDAKKAKDLFRDNEGNDRLAFYPYSEEARDLVDIDVDRLRDPEPAIHVIWTTQDDDQLNKLNTWDEIYEIRSRVEGKFRSLEIVIEDEINPTDSAHLEEQIADKARDVPESTLKRKEWAFWYQRLFYQLSKIDVTPFAAKWDFIHQQGAQGGDYILNP